ncbi:MULTISPECIES: hypothetical protein [unclassified Streptomyces]|uniref:hypothetical protein n=1 Tax=unclassified Streptomyces TaxID=2593676 RepID=UPI002E2F2B55|nr:MULTISPECIES: hypothetical protein [unclassified Streptomyces]WUC68991.1 hypothetical protein OG861_32560 [Streptomyces sp. NBC_00539]
MTDYVQAVIDVLGHPQADGATPAAWQRLEGELGRSLPGGEAEGTAGGEPRDPGIGANG